ncbi:DNRLRE domain-containing protein [Brevibacillus sp. NPDC003359]|uniref:DNRLRE domain-containing protein n=1 Tax=unclassified Brevibacillus TaxID=2684853 RepID=UPI00367A1B02
MPVITLTKDNSKVFDTWFDESRPLINHEQNPQIYIATDSNGKRNRLAFFFDLGLIPNDAIINSAAFEMFQSGDGGISRTIDVHAITSAWTDSNTWNTQPTYNPTPSTSKLIGTGVMYSLFDVKNLVQSMVNGQNNQGFLLKDRDEATANVISKSFNSFENGVNHPRLTIDYTIPTTGKKQVDYVGSGTPSAATSMTNFTPIMPTGIQAGDLLIARIAYDSVNTFVPPVGWAEQKAVSSNGRHKVLTKIASANESAPTFTTNPTVSQNWGGNITVFRNVKSVLNSDARAITSSQSFYPASNGSSVNTSHTDTLLVIFNAIGATNSNFSVPLNFHEVLDVFPTGSSNTFQTVYSYMHHKQTLTSVEVTSIAGNGANGSSIALFLEPITNNPPSITLSSPSNNQTLAEGSTYKLEGTVSDVDAGQSLSVKYSIAGGPTQTIALGTTDGSNPKSFSKTLTYSQGRFWDGQTDVSGLLPSEASSIQIWANDGTDDSAKVTRNFTVAQEDGKVFVPVNVVSSAYLVSRMAPPVRLSNGWLVGAVVDAFKTSVKFYKSSDNGKIYSLLTSFNIGVSGSYSIVCKGTNVYCVANGSAKVFVARFDATNVGATIASAYDLDVSQSVFQGVSLAITPDGTKLCWAASTKNSSLPNSFSIRAGSIPINADGTLVTPSAVERVTGTNSSTQNMGAPSIVFSASGEALILSIFQEPGAYTLLCFGKSSGFTGNWFGALDGWKHQTVYATSNSYPQSSSMAIRTPNGKLHAVWHGTDANDTVNPWIRYSNATMGADWLPTHKKLVKGTNASITSDKNGKLIITYEDGVYIKRIESSNEFSTFSGPFIDGVGTNPATFYDQSFQTDFSIPPTIYQTSGAVKYRGVLNLNKRPVVTLGTPDNQTLTENSTLKVSGQAIDEDAGNIVSVFFKVNNGPAQAASSSISDGGTPILFDKALTYKNKRIYLGTTDLTGIDLAENTDHCLIVWAEDNKQGKSLEVVCKFRAVWNRPPVIDGEDKDLGIFMKPPTVNYSATDPEANTFTFTEYLNGKQIRSFAGVAGQQYTVEISHDAWIRLDLDVQHQIKIVATDSTGVSSERIYTFTRTETHIEFMLEYGNPDIKADFTLDGMPLRVLVTLERYLPEGSSIESVKVCNNYLDDVPTWEDCTNAVKVNRGYLFTNKNKTAPKWAINLWVTINKGTARERVLVNGYGGAFD